MENNPLYQQGLDYFGRGEWPKAIDCLTQLQADYPNDPRIAQFLETARLRAAMGPGLERRAASPMRSAWLRRLPLLGAIVVLLAIAAGVYVAYQTWVLPAQAANARLLRLDKLRQAAQIQIASGQYADAVKTYQSILLEAPDDAVSSANLARAIKLDQVAALYTQATQAINAGNQPEAIRLLEQINSLEANYRDSATLLEQVKSTLVVSQSFDQAAALAQAAKWPEAAQAFESIRTNSPSYKPQEVQDYLFKAYFTLGNQQLEQANTIAAVDAANSLFQKALSVRPLDPKADMARRVGQSFLEGAAAYETKDWETVIPKLTVVYEQQPNYYGGKVAQWLYEAYMATGDAFLGKNDPTSARDRFAKALRLANSDSQKADAQKRFEVADRLTTPTPTLQPSPTPIPTGTPLPAGYIAPAYTRSQGGGAGAPTPDPSPFRLVDTIYQPNTLTGHGCSWSGVTGRLFDMKGAPLTLPGLGVRIDAVGNVYGVAAGSNPIIGPSGWSVQWDTQPVQAKGQVQVIYKDKPVSAPIYFTTRGTCDGNLLILQIQQVKPLP